MRSVSEATSDIPRYDAIASSSSGIPFLHWPPSMIQPPFSFVALPHLVRKDKWAKPNSSADNEPYFITQGAKRGTHTFRPPLVTVKYTCEMYFTFTTARCVILTGKPNCWREQVLSMPPNGTDTQQKTFLQEWELTLKEGEHGWNIHNKWWRTTLDNSLTIHRGPVP